MRIGFFLGGRILKEKVCVRNEQKFFTFLYILYIYECILRNIFPKKYFYLWLKKRKMYAHFFLKNLDFKEHLHQVFFLSVNCSSENTFIQIKKNLYINNKS